MTRSVPAANGESGRHIVIVGCGNIGSYLAPLVARRGLIGRLTLVDPDRYEARNLVSQRITPEDIDRTKVEAQAERIRQLHHGLEVIPIASRVEDVPFGRLRGDLLLTCLDSRAARQAVNAIVVRLGLLWIDAGVNPEQQLARISVFAPGPDQACLECSWGQAEYDTLERLYSCQGERLSAPPTGATAALGSLAASLQALECERLLQTGPTDRDLGRLVAISARGDRTLKGHLQRNPRCLVEPHEKISTELTETQNLRLTIRELQCLHKIDAGRAGPRLWAAGRQFVTRLFCPQCHRSRHVLLLQRRVAASPLRCPACQLSLRVAAGGLADVVDRSLLALAGEEPTFEAMGFAPGDLFTLETAGRGIHYEFALEGIES